MYILFYVERNKTMKYWEVKEGEWKEKEYA